MRSQARWLPQSENIRICRRQCAGPGSLDRGEQLGPVAADVRRIVCAQVLVVGALPLADARVGASAPATACSRYRPNEKLAPWAQRGWSTTLRRWWQSSVPGGGFPLG